MPYYKQPSPSPFNGVSQQDPSVMLASQVELQVNALSSVTERLKRRPPLEYVSKLSASLTSENATDLCNHPIDRNNTERYQVVLVNDDLYVWDIEGNSKSVDFPDGKDYLSSGSLPYRQRYRLLTIADTTFVVNREVDVAMDSETTSESIPQAIIWVKQGLSQVEYTVKVNGSQVADFPQSSSSETPSSIEIANTLKSDLDSSLSSGWTITQNDNYISIKKDDDSDFTIEVDDGYGGTAMHVIKDEIQDLGKVPPKAVHGHVIKIIGDVDEDQDDYYQKFIGDSESGSIESGHWIESVAPGIEYKFDASTMPHVLVRESDGSFTFREHVWADREVGDSESNDDPSFVGKPIDEVFYTKRRLGFLSGINKILSRADYLNDFWRTTVTTILDSDRIDIEIASGSAKDLRNAVEHDERILLFSDSDQVVVQSGDILTSETVETVLLTSYSNNPEVRPVVAGASLMFPFNRSGYSGVREFITTSDSQISGSAADITKHVPRYLQGELTRLTTMTNEDLMVCHTDYDPSVLYVYQWFWNGQEKLQSAWHEWKFPGDSLGSSAMGDKLYFLIAQTDGLFLCSMDISDGYTDEGQEILTHLDRRLDDTQVSMSYDSETNLTTITLPYEFNEDLIKVTMRASGTKSYGFSVPVVGATSTTVSVTGDFTGDSLWIGETYETKVKPRRPVRQEQTDDGRVSDHDERIQVEKMSVRYADTGYFQVEVSPHESLQAYTYTMTPRILGTTEAILGELNISSGVFEFPCRANSKDLQVVIKTSSHLPMRILSTEWSGRVRQ